tara:strand:+ start:144 stop:836 length:693 start_codon:yes stop_codon:yes gene_type:complete
MFVMFSVLLNDVKADPYVDMIKDYYRKMEKISSPTSKKVYHISYTEQIVSNEPGQSIKTNVNIYSSEDKFYYYTGLVDLFQDANDAFLIVHKEKMVYHTNSVENSKSKRQFSSYLKIQEKFFETGKILLSEVVVLNGKKVARVSIETPKELDPRLKVVRTTYWFDIEAKKLIKTKVDFDSSYQIKSKVTEYNELNLNYKKKLKKAVFKKVIDKKGQLLEPYKSYKLVVNK